MLSKFLPRQLLPLGALTTAALACLTSLAGAAALTPGNLVVVRVGDGTAALTSAATAVFLDEYTPAGVFVQTLVLPTTASGANFRFSNAGTSTSEGFLNLSVNGQYLVHGGYDAALGTASIAGTTSVANPRVVARIDMAGNIDTTTALSDAYSAGNIRSATSDDGTQFWTGGTASTSGSVRYATLGGTTSTQLATTPTNTRVVGIHAGQLYVSSASGTFQGVSTVGTGLPTASGQTITLLNGFPTATGPSSYDYFFADASTLYVADDRLTGVGGIQKWTESGGLWTLAYTLAPAATSGCRGLTGVVNAGVATLTATTSISASSGNSIVQVTDTGMASTFSTLATAPANTAFRGIRLAGNATSSIIAYCDPGVAGVIACPCGNAPAGSNQGCSNSAGAGASISGSGTPSLGADTLVVTATGIASTGGSCAGNPASLTCILLQGINLSAGGIGFNDGVRCVANPLKRIEVGASTAGTFTSSVPIAATSAGLTPPDVITAGTNRYYMVFYRDACASWACVNVNSNVSNSLQVLWGN